MADKGVTFQGERTRGETLKDPEEGWGETEWRSTAIGVWMAVADGMALWAAHNDGRVPAFPYSMKQVCQAGREEGIETLTDLPVIGGLEIVQIQVAVIEIVALAGPVDKAGAVGRDRHGPG